MWSAGRTSGIPAHLRSDCPVRWSPLSIAAEMKPVSCRATPLVKACSPALVVNICTPQLPLPVEQDWSELPWVSLGCIMYGCGLGGKLSRECCCLLKASKQLLKRHLSASRAYVQNGNCFSVSIGWRMWFRAELKAPQNVWWESTRGNNALSSYSSFLRG